MFFITAQAVKQNAEISLQGILTLLVYVGTIAVIVFLIKLLIDLIRRK